MKLNRIQRVIKGDINRYKTIDEIYHKINWMYKRSIYNPRMKMFERDIHVYKDYALKLYREFWLISENVR